MKKAPISFWGPVIAIVLSSTCDRSSNGKETPPNQPPPAQTNQEGGIEPPAAGTGGQSEQEAQGISALHRDAYSAESDCGRHIWKLGFGRTEFADQALVTWDQLDGTRPFGLGYANVGGDHRFGQQTATALPAKAFEEGCEIAETFFNPLNYQVWEAASIPALELEPGEYFSFAPSLDLISNGSISPSVGLRNGEKPEEAFSTHEFQASFMPWISKGNVSVSKPEDGPTAGTLLVAFNCSVPLKGRFHWHEENEPLGNRAVCMPSAKEGGGISCLRLSITNPAEQCTMETQRAFVPDNKRRWQEVGWKGFLDLMSVDGEPAYLATINLVKIGAIITP